ncbi:hypothetical protein BLNAU_10842 [Blattamonas nauphoetae]|uniref:Uncharacterized protein n=1 Tax=Blattamonas nauphoetae TaxID=2049346 RepID=A0ABQ9XP41_9EUKA|nr:hypothetical protein BLNAU_10842 [Blattamonas nauphoetae]
MSETPLEEDKKNIRFVSMFPDDDEDSYYTSSELHDLAAHLSSQYPDMILDDFDEGQFAESEDPMVIQALPIDPNEELFLVPFFGDDEPTPSSSNQTSSPLAKLFTFYHTGLLNALPLVAHPFQSKIDTAELNLAHVEQLSNRSIFLLNWRPDSTSFNAMIFLIQGSEVPVIFDTLTQRTEGNYHLFSLDITSTRICRHNNNALAPEQTQALTDGVLGEAEEMLDALMGWSESIRPDGDNEQAIDEYRRTIQTLSEEYSIVHVLTKASPSSVLASLL